jgi:hypothetical protein
VSTERKGENKRGTVDCTGTLVVYRLEYYLRSRRANTYFSLVPSLSIKLKDAAKDRSELELAPPQEEGDAGQRNVEDGVSKQYVGTVQHHKHVKIKTLSS